ncbi:DUF6194 family protein [Georgenia alba]|uniref:DUF6194 family protein n=1 Tax=Georgenia alba TaxID=2233858 RepID=A0ABW2Q5K2_9MICO
MSMDEIIDTVRGFEGVLELAPTEGSAFPEIAWGDHFFYYAPDGRTPEREQPYATVVTKDYPGDVASDLGHPDRARLNIHVGRTAFTELTGEDPRAASTTADLAAVDIVLPHPLYRAQGWIAIINPGVRTRDLAVRLLRQAHDDARRRAARRGRAGGPG